MNAAAPKPYDLCIVGSGMAGLSAALFAARRGLSTIVVGRTGEIIFATGFLDLLAVPAPETGEVWDDPWAGLAALVAAQPRHPYARIPAERIRSAFDGLVAFLADQGLPYVGEGDRNVQAVTSVGTLKTSYRVPATAWNGVVALGRRSACLIADIQGLKGFSARQIAATLGDRWPGVRTTRLSLPGSTGPGEVFPERLARSLEVASSREALAAELRPRLGTAAVVGLPAVLGVSGSAEVLRDLETRLGVPVFEIPTMPPGVTGLRLKEAFERGLKGLGVTLCLESKVVRTEPDPGGGFRLHAGPVRDVEEVIAARAVILATGRFMGGGLQADRQRVSETAVPPAGQPPRAPGRLAPRGFPRPPRPPDQPGRGRGRRGLSAGRRGRSGGAPAAARRGVDPGPPGLDAHEVRVGARDCDGVGRGRRVVPGKRRRRP